MPKGRISKKSVDAFQCPPDKIRELFWDDAISGFGVCALPTGKKQYVIQYRQHGRSRRVSIGVHGRLTPDEARSLAKTMLGQVETGADPVADKREARAIRTFREVADDFMSKHVQPKRKARTAVGYRQLLDNHILAAFGSKRVIEVRKRDVTALHNKMEAKGAANRTVALISAIWGWAANNDEVSVDANPAKGVERYPEKAKETFLNTEQLTRLGDTLRLAETTGLPWSVDEGGSKARHLARAENRVTKVDPFAAAAIRLLILTGARLQEIVTLRWEFIDFERGLLNLPDSKTGAKPVYLSAAALQILNDLPRIEGNLFVIAGSMSGKPRSDLKRPWAAITRAANLPGLRLHDLRHSFASVGAGGGMGLPVIGALLGHKRSETTARYSHLDADPLRRAVETISATITAAMDGNKGAEIIPLARRK